MPTETTNESGGASYRCSERRAPSADESWLASVSAAAVPASPDPGGPAEAEAALPGGGASLYSAGPTPEGPSAGGVQTGHWDQTDLSEAQFDVQVFLSRNRDSPLADPE